MKMEILKSLVSTGPYKGFIDAIFSLIEHKTHSYVCFANVHMLVEAYKNPQFRRVLNTADIVAPDGKPVALCLNLFHHVHQDRVCGMDILPDLLKRAEEANRSVYFYGTTNELLECIVAKANKEYPSLKIAGYYSPPFRTLTEKETNDIVQKINDVAPDLVFVSLGCPKQENWMAQNKTKINGCMLGLGQAFKVYAGKEKRLPVWMRNLSLEWAYRLYLEPGRLWKRYLYTNTYFVWLTVNFWILLISHKLSFAIPQTEMMIESIEPGEE